MAIGTQSQRRTPRFSTPNEALLNAERGASQRRNGQTPVETGRSLEQVSSVSSRLARDRDHRAGHRRR